MFFKKKKSIEETMTKLKIDLVKLAIEGGKDWDKNLDFSEDSLKDLSYILNQLHAEYNEDPEMEGLMGLCYNYGFYIIAVIEKHISEGVVLPNHPEFGEATFPFTVKDMTLFPVIWCLKQIENGKQDDVYIKYKAFKEQLSKKQ